MAKQEAIKIADYAKITNGQLDVSAIPDKAHLEWGTIETMVIWRNGEKVLVTMTAAVGNLADDEKVLQERVVKDQEKLAILAAAVEPK